jgi:hypothetical protein
MLYQSADPIVQQEFSKAFIKNKQVHVYPWIHYDLIE